MRYKDYVKPDLVKTRSARIPRGKSLGSIAAPPSSRSRTLTGSKSETLQLKSALSTPGRLKREPSGEKGKVPPSRSESRLSKVTSHDHTRKINPTEASKLGKTKACVKKKEIEASVPCRTAERSHTESVKVAKSGSRSSVKSVAVKEEKKTGAETNTVVTSTVKALKERAQRSPILRSILRPVLSKNEKKTPSPVEEKKSVTKSPKTSRFSLNFGFGESGKKSGNSNSSDNGSPRTPRFSLKFGWSKKSSSKESINKDLENKNNAEKYDSQDIIKLRQTSPIVENTLQEWDSSVSTYLKTLSAIRAEVALIKGVSAEETPDDDRHDNKKQNEVTETGNVIKLCFHYFEFMNKLMRCNRNRCYYYLFSDFSFTIINKVMNGNRKKGVIISYISFSLS